MDLCSRKIVGWPVENSMPVELVKGALEMALSRRQAKAGLVLHSDRGVQYDHGNIRTLLSHMVSRSV
jgi:transposase InsO family protein